jgi:hypothetical protein
LKVVPAGEAGALSGERAAVCASARLKARKRKNFRMAIVATKLMSA